MIRHRYQLDLTHSIPSTRPSSGRTRSVDETDLDAIAHLMLNAYLGTIDYDGETLSDAIAEVRSFFEGHPMLGHSYLIEVGGEPVSAILIAIHDSSPLVRSVMTLPEYKGQGLARHLTATAMRSLAEGGHDTLVLYITEGNVASEMLFASLGAVRVPEPQARITGLTRP